MTKKALITGITGQDGSYLAELLVQKGYEVHGIVRRVALEDPEHRLWRIRHLRNTIELHTASIESFPSIYRTVQKIKPDECYHFAAQSFVATSFDEEFSIMNANINGTHFILASLLDWAPDCKFYFAATSEMFGNAEESPQKESTRFMPRSLYGISKLAGYHLTRNYREVYGIKASCGILYNHESPRRGYEYVTRKISSHVAKIKLGLEKELRLGNIEARRDWGHAREYVQAMWLMLQQDTPDDYVIATGKTHAVREFLDVAFSHVGLNYEDYIVIDPNLTRPVEAIQLVGEPGKAEKKLGWKYSTSFEDLIREMVDSDLAILSKSAS